MRKTSLWKSALLVGLPLAVMMAFLLFPFYWTFLTSMKTTDEVNSMAVIYWSENPSFASYTELFAKFNFIKPILNSLLVALVTVAFSLAISLLAAYAFSRYRFPGRKVFMCMFLVNNMFPGVLLMLPLFVIMRRYGLLYTPASLVLSYTTFTIPFTVWLLNGYLNDLPNALEEAAMIDGGNRAQAFLHIILPIMVPCLLATGVYIFMNAWNEYVFAVLFTNESTRTVPVALRSLIGQFGVEWNTLCTGGIITVIPVCVMFFFAQRRLVAGMTAGAVKG